MKYADIRDTLKSGDVVACPDRGTLFGWLIRLVTKSKYAHVGIVWRIGNRVFMLEDRAWSGVSIRSLSGVPPFDLYPVSVEWTEAREDFAISRLQKPYSWLDAIRLGLGLRPSKNGQVCSLFVADVLGLPREDATPGRLVESLNSSPIPVE